MGRVPSCAAPGGGRSPAADLREPPERPRVFSENNCKWSKREPEKWSRPPLRAWRRTFSGCVACGSAAHETPGGGGGGVEGKKEFFLLQIPFFIPSHK